jgi:phosphoglycerate kinase
MKTIDQVAMKGKRVLVRVDFNVPMDKAGNVTDDTRVRAVLPTIRHAMEAGAKVIVCSHLGRPKGKRAMEYSLKPVVGVLAGLLQREVGFLDDCIGDTVEKAVGALKEGDVVLLENLRFHPGEDANDPVFARQLARLCDVYIDDAFAVAHRAAASNTAIAQFAAVCAAGFLMKNEIDYFNRAMGDPQRPLVAVIGGAKVSDKIGVLEKIIEKVDSLLVGGGMAFTFLKAAGYGVGKSLCETEMLDTARTITAKARERKVKLLLPVDCVVAKSPTADAETGICAIDRIPADAMGLDIGPDTIRAFAEVIRSARTIVWNGPLGMFELAPFSNGTFSLIRAAADSGALTIVGGGDTDTAVHQAGQSDRISYISTGGGAFLELLEGKILPGVAALG